MFDFIADCLDGGVRKPVFSDDDSTITEKVKRADLFKEIIPSLTTIKENLFDSEVLQSVADYPAYVVNKHFSFSPDTLLYANEINKWTNQLSSKQLYDFWFYALPKSKSFTKWIKSTEDREEIELIKEYYGCSELKAKQYSTVLTPTQINIIKQRLGKVTNTHHEANRD